MKDLAPLAKTYIFSTILIGIGLMGWNLVAFTLNPQDIWMVAGLSGIASLALMFKVEGPTNRSHYNTSFLVYSFTLVLLGTPAAAIVILVSNLVEWAKHKYPWYIQSFNIGSYFWVLHISGWVYKGINPDNLLFDFTGVLAILAAMATFVFLNHLAIGVVIWLARGENFSQSGIFDFLPMMLDFTLLNLGAGIAFVWQQSPFAIVLVLPPIYIMYNILKLPLLERETETDSKTKLFNDRYFSQALEMELERASRFDRDMTLVMGDLDMLRNINNTYGHLAGDEVLMGIADILKNSFREHDIIARFGGEEFSILMPEITPEAAYPRIEQVRKAINDTEFHVSTSVSPIKVTISFGIAGRHGSDQSPADILHNADIALYHAKLKGRNATFIFSENNFEDFYKANQLRLTDPQNSNHNPPQTAETINPPQQSQLRPQDANELENATASSQVVAGKKYPGWLVNIYIAGLFIIAAGLTAAVRASLELGDWVGFAIFAGIVVFSEWLSLDLFIKDSSVSTSAASLIGGTLLFGPAGALGLSLVFALSAFIKHRSPFNRFIFNFSNQVIAGMIYSIVILTSGSLFGDWSLPIQALVSLLAALIVFIITSLLIAIGIEFDRGVSFKQVWNDQFRWLAPYYLVMGFLAYALAISYQELGIPGLSIIIMPLLVLRLSQKQYINRTKEAVESLQNKNIELKQQSEEISTLNEELFQVFAYILDTRDPFVLGHSQQVARYAMKIAQGLKLPLEKVELLRKAALLHDIGKIGIPESILTSPSWLSQNEKKLVQKHVELGAEIVRNCNSLIELVPIIYHHHEQYDGNGYPDGLQGNQIPLEARILGLADAVEAMSSDRPYRQALSYEDIVKEVKENAGVQFDPTVVDVFINLVQKEGESFFVNSAHKIHIPL